MPNDVSREAGPAAWDLLIRNTRLLDRDDPVDIAVQGGLIAAMAGNIGGTSARTIDAAGGLSTPSFNEPHFHLDKVLSRHLHGAVSFHEAFTRARDVKKQFTAGDVEERACRALDLALAQGTARMRAHVDVDFATGTVSMEGILAARERYRGAIDLQVIAFPQEGIVTDPEAPDLLREAVAMGAEFIGGLPEFEASVEDQKVHVDTIFDLAEECDVGLDIHCDYTDTPDLRTLEMVTDVTRERGMQGRVFAGHCNALSLYSDDHARADRLGQAIAERWPGTRLGEAEAACGRPFTNIVAFRHPDALGLLDHLRLAGIRAGLLAPGIVRFVTHLDVDDTDIARPVTALSSAPA